jgi:hypothetical protein
MIKLVITSATIKKILVLESNRFLIHTFFGTATTSTNVVNDQQTNLFDSTWLAVLALLLEYDM